MRRLALAQRRRDLLHRDAHHLRPPAGVETRLQIHRGPAPARRREFSIDAEDRKDFIGEIEGLLGNQRNLARVTTTTTTNLGRGSLRERGVTRDMRDKRDRWGCHA
jgi:hypothetical protein